LIFVKKTRFAIEISALFSHLWCHPQSHHLKEEGRQPMTMLLPTEPTLSTVLVLMTTSSTTIPTPLLPPTATTCRTTPTMSRRWLPHSQPATTTTIQEELEFTALDTLAIIQLGLCLLLMLMCLFCTRHLLGNPLKII
jgi:hypothetical protein